MQGKQTVPGRPWSGFHGWQSTIGGMLQGAKVEGFLNNLAELHDAADPEQDRWHGLLCSWQDKFGSNPVRTQDLWLSLEDYGQRHELPATLAESLGSAHDDSARKTRLANKLRLIQGRRFGHQGIRVEKAGKDAHVGVALWKILDDAGPIGNQFDFPTGTNSVDGVELTNDQ